MDAPVHVRDAEYRKTVLPSGIRVVTEALPGVRTVALGVWVETGSRFEPPGWSGIAHFTEHMMFKGTRRRTAQRIAEEADALGAQLNAFTDREHTCYYVRVLSEHLPKVTDLLADMLTGSLFEEEALERERQVILEEIKMYEDSPDDLVQDLFLETVWAHDPLGRPVIGFRHTVESLRRPDFVEFVSREYRSPRLLVAAAGDVDHDQVVEQAAELLGPLSAEAPPRGASTPSVSLDSTYRTKDTEQVHLCFGYPGLPQGDPDRYVLSVLDHVAGGGMSSRLFQEVREKRGLVYSIYSFAASYGDGGLFGIYAGTGESEAAELLPLVCEELARLPDSLEEEEVRRARAQIRAGILMSRESTGSRCEQLAQQLLVFGRPLPVPEIVGRIEAVDRAQLAGLARRLAGAPPTLAALGPIGRVEPLDRLARRLG